MGGCRGAIPVTRPDFKVKARERAWQVLKVFGQVVPSQLDRGAFSLRLGPIEVFMKEAEGVVAEDGVSAVEELDAGTVGNA